MNAKNSGRIEAVIALASAIVKISAQATMGIFSELPTSLATLAADQAKDVLARRKLERLLDDCVDSITERMQKYFEVEFSSIPENELMSAIDGTKEAFHRIERDLILLVVSADAHPRILYRKVSPIAQVVAKEKMLSRDAAEVLLRLTSEACAYLVSIGSTFPQFSTTALVELLQRSTQIRDDVRHILERMPSARTGDDFTTDYNRAVVNRLDRMEIFGLHITATRHYPLSVSFVSLSVRSRQLANSGDEQVRARANLRVEQVLQNRTKLFLIGDAGSGKTTLLRWLAVSCARQTFDVDMSDWNDCTPFLLSLRDYSRGDFPSPDKFPETLARNFSAEMPKEWVHTKMRTGKALILIDGIDELHDKTERAKAYDWITDLTQDFHRARFVVTSRPAAVDTDRLRNFFAVDLQTMTPDDVILFVRRWHQAVATELSSDEERAELEVAQTKFLSAITFDRHLRHLSVNPLLCAMLCTLNKERDAELPKDRIEIYRAALDMLLGGRDRHRGVAPVDDLPESNKIFILQDLAFWLMRQGDSVASTDQAQKIIERTLRALGRAEVNAAKCLNVLMERSGLLWRPQEGKVSFIHRTFQEYLTGKAAVENDEIGLLLSNADEDHWHEVIIMAVGHAQPKQCERLFEGLLAQSAAAQAKRASELANKLHLLAVACLQTSSILDDSLRSRVEALAEDLVPPKSVAAAQSLANVGDLVLHILSDPRRHPTSASEAEYTVRLLSIIGNEEALRVLGDVAEKFSGIDAELMNAWRLFDRDTFASRVIQRANLEPYQVIKETEVVSHIDKMHSVRSIRFEVPNMATFTNLPVVLRTLESVYVLRNARSNIDGLQNLRSVAQLEIEIDHTSIDLTPLGEISALRALSIKIVRAISVRLDLTPLQKLTSLSRIHLLGDGTIHVDLSPLKAHQNLVITLSRAVRATGINDLHSTFTLNYV